MTTTHVVILAQGTQSRLPALTVAKQMLPLPACGGIPILHRTLRQLFHLLGRAESPSMSRITVVTWFPLMEELTRQGAPILYDAEGPIGRFHPSVDTMDDPGNSSLKGVSKYWDRIEHGGYDRVVILLGDVVYSWACLRALLDATAATSVRFVGTKDLSASRGELWGIYMASRFAGTMKQMLERAMAHHPPFDTYQCGQLRRWLWEVDKLGGHALTAGGRDWYVPVDDYTRDIDLPEHVAMLVDLSTAAAEDDRKEGITW